MRTYKSLATVVAVLIVMRIVLIPVDVLAQSPTKMSVTPVLRAAQTLQLATVFIPATNQATTWSVNPAIGTVSPTGLYTAPSSISAVQTVVVTSTNVAYPSVSAAVTITLQPSVTLSVSPAQTTLLASQSQQFTASLTESADKSVSWSVNPPIGSISASGLYTAPSVISLPQSVLVTATSQADPTANSSATVKLQPGGIVVTILPQSAQLSASQSQQFSVSITGTTNPNVAWALKPNLGMIANGVYTAPASISASQQVSLTATSMADSTKSASATISLVGQVGIALAPPSISLSAGQSTQFTAAISGTANTAVTWSLSPAVGTVTNGLYTSPVNISAQQTVTIAATSVADPTKSSQAVITLTPSSQPPSGTPPPSAITLPIEVVGPAGTTETVTVPVPSGVDLSRTKLWMQIHGLKYAGKASVQVNNAPWVSIDDNSVTLLGLAKAYGGVGGGFATLKMTLDLPPGTIAPGNNTLRFRFNATAGGLGFRVLKFNFVQPDGAMLLPSTLFVDDDPNRWQPPLPSADDIAAGKQLFQTASILHAGVPVRAHCNNCHTQDGRDLHYFNYSNKFLHYGAVRSGLTDHQGDQIASYIRSLNVPNPGRPWNPPYQPGPGMDSKPVEDWAAGAGLDAVLDNDSDMLPYLMPGGSTASWAATGNINVRETPIPMQMPDWNSWLPDVNPIDAWGDEFTTSTVNKWYGLLRAGLKPGDPVAYNSNLVNFRFFFSSLFYFLSPKQFPATDPRWTAAYVTKIYSTWRWGMIKDFELNQEFQLEGLAQAIHGPGTEPRSWYAGFPFMASPNMLHIPIGAPGVHNGSVPTWEYFANIWYQLQLVVNDTDRPNGARTIDWPYVYGKMKDLSYQDSPPQAATFMLWMVKGLQTSELDGPPSAGTAGWHPGINSLDLLVYPNFEMMWTGYSPSQRASMSESYLRQWFAKVHQFTPQQWYAGGWASANEVIVPKLNTSWGNSLYYTLPQLRFLGVDNTLLGQVADWAKTVWPLGTWDKTKTAACTSVQSSIHCSY